MKQLKIIADQSQNYSNAVGFADVILSDSVIESNKDENEVNLEHNIAYLGKDIKAYDHRTYYEETNGESNLSLGGLRYHAGFKIGTYADGGYAIYNIDGKYTHFSGIAGNVDHTKYGVSYAIYGDAVLIGTVDVVEGGLPVQFDFDVTNKLLLGYIASQIEMCIRNGHTLSIVIDNISLTKGSSDIIKLLSTNSSRCNVTITTSDLYAMVNSDEKLMYTFLGNSLENIIMQHGSAVSAEKWSKAIGYYDKTETTTTVSQGKTKGGFSLFPSYNENKSLAYSIKREAIVKSEEIIRMSNNEMYIYDRIRNELRHCYVTN